MLALTTPCQGVGFRTGVQVQHLALALAQHVHHRAHVLLWHLNDGLLKGLILMPIHLLGNNLHTLQSNYVLSLLLLQFMIKNLTDNDNNIVHQCVDSKGHAQSKKARVYFMHA